MIREIRYSKFIEERPRKDELPVEESVVTLINSRGEEVLDDTPVSIPIYQAVAPSSILDLVHSLYRSMKENDEYETFADADDFVVEDELGIEMETTPYEQNFDHIASDTASSAEPPAVSHEPEKVTE